MKWVIPWGLLLKGIRRRLQAAYVAFRTRDGTLLYNGLHRYRKPVEEALKDPTFLQSGLHFFVQGEELCFFRTETLGEHSVWVSGGPLRDGEPPPAYTLSPTERRMLLSAQRIEERLLRLCFFHFPLGVVFLSFGEGRILFWNSTMEALTGKREKEVLGRRWDEVFPQEMLDDMWQSLRFGEEYLVRNFRLQRNSTLNGDRLLNLRFFSWREGETMRVVGLVEDVTERARWGESIRQMERLSSIGRFVSSMAHEINNPLGVIYGYTQMLLAQIEGNNNCPTCQMTRKVLEKIEREAAHCSEVIRYLVDFSRPLVLQREPTDINTLLRESLALVDFFCAENERVEFAFEENLPLVLVDRTRMRQVFMNLAKNAFEAMRERGGVLRISTESVLLENVPPWEGKKRFSSYVKVVFADTGKGIPETLLPRIFEPFFTTKERGTGLGLSISYGIVRAHGGWIEVTSKEGVGTKVQVFLPVERGSET
uniref:histidine kinase n=1 Tax=Candidatus Caldatribacterium saccharofermentans TaxID=1454753 RepID=A0A7V4WLG6_9BACT